MPHAPLIVNIPSLPSWINKAAYLALLLDHLSPVCPWPDVYVNHSPSSSSAFWSGLVYIPPFLPVLSFLKIYTMWAFYENLWAKGDHRIKTSYRKGHLFRNRYPEWKSWLCDRKPLEKCFLGGLAGGFPELYLDSYIYPGWYFNLLSRW